MRLSVLAIVVGALVALVVYAVGTAITALRHEDLIWGIVALVVWFLVAVYWRAPAAPPRP